MNANLAQPVIAVKALKYTGKRQNDYQTQVVQGRLRGQARNDVVNRLNKLEKKARQQKAKRDVEREKREAELERLARIAEAQKEAEREARRKQKQKEYNEKRKAKRKAEREAKKVNAIVDIRTNKITDVDIFHIEVVEGISSNLKPLIGQTHAYIQASQNGTIVVSELIKITGKNELAIFWSDIWRYISVYVSGRIYNIFDSHWGGDYEALDDNDNVRFVVLKADAIPAESIRQRFRDGAVHCVIEPLYMLWKKMEENSEKESSRKRCGQIARRIKALESVYPEGVPEDKMDEVAKMSHRCIIIHDIIGNEITRYNKNSSQFFHFTNTRVNHLDTGYITLDKQYEHVSQDEINKIMREHNKANDFYLFSGDMKNEEAQSIRSSKGAWAVFNEDHQLFNEFSNSLGIRNYGIDAVKYSDLNAFVKEARLINSAPTPLCENPNDIDDVNHIDIEKAYTQHKHSKYYKGFLGHIQQWRKLPFDTNAVEFLDTHLGIFQFMVLSNTDELLTKLGITAGKAYTLPSPEILYFIKECGLAVRLIAGAWGSSFDIEYTDEMLENRRYCIWAGKLGVDKDIDVYTFKGNREWASHLKSVLGDEQVMYFSEQEMIIVKINKKSYYTTHHILAFITSYTRLNMFDIMRKIDGELVKVILDGIYFRGEIPDVEIPHKNNKDKIRHIGFRDAWYFPAEVKTDKWATYNKNLDGSCVLAGAGGTGKSYSVLTDKGFINPLYVVPSHLLGRKCREKYGCSYTTINKLIGEECRPFKETHYEPGIIFIDELTMIEGKWIEKAIEMYPNALMFIAGDIDEKQWFQCRNGHPGEFSKIWLPGNKWRYVYYTNDMRSKDNELKEFKTAIRAEMKRVFTDGNQNDAVRMNYYVKKNYKTTPFEEAVKMFQPGDYWIAGTHKTNEKLLERGVVSGYINKNKEIVLEDETGAVKRGSFTTHSFQGLTIETERVFISLDFFEYAMLYTSISRVCNFNQIVLVN
jgi:hypothetical protein